MKKNFFMINQGFVRKLTSLFMLVVFSLTTILLPAKASAQSMSIPGVNLPAVGSMLTVTPAFAPAIIRGMTVYPDNPLKFDFIINTGDDNLKGSALEKESQKLIKYFLASLTTPENEFWVNLSPYEKDRIIPEALGATEMGRDMLAQDYILKQLTASLLYPEKDLGNKFWQSVREKAKKLYGVSEVPVDTFNKVWIMPDKAAVYENDNRVFVVERHLKVMLEEDYEALDSQRAVGLHAGAPSTAEAMQKTDVNSVSSQILRDLIIPEIEKEVNEGQNFAAVRQIYNSMILATWYKKRLKESLLGQVYVNQNKVKGIDLADRETKQKIYEQYLAAFKKGVYSYIKEDIDALTNEPIPTKYFSGGLVGVAGDKLGVFTGSIENQSEVVSTAVTGSLTANGQDVIVSSALLENASQAQVAAATPVKSALTALTALGTNASFAIPASPFSDSNAYTLTRAAGDWTVSMGGVVEQINGFGLTAATWAGQAAEFATNNPATVVLAAVALYAAASFDPIGYFRNKVEFNLRQSNALKDDDQKRYIYLDRIVARGQEVVPDLLNQFQQSDASPSKVRDIAYVLGKLKVTDAVEPLIAKLDSLDGKDYSSNFVLKEIALALGTIGGSRALLVLLEKMQGDDSYRSIIFAEAVGKLGDQRGNEFLLEKLSNEKSSVRIAAAQALAELKIQSGIDFLIESLKHDIRAALIHPRTVLSQLGIKDNRIEIFDRARKELQAVLPSYERGDVISSFPGELTEAYRILLRGGKFAAQYSPEIHDVVMWSQVWDTYSGEDGVAYENYEPASLRIIDLSKGSDSIAASSGIDDLKLTGAADGLTVSAEGVSELGSDSLTARTSDASSSAIVNLINNSVRLNILQLSPIFSTDRRLKAIGNLARLGDQRARAPLAALLMEDNLRIKSATADALGRLNDQSVKGPLLALLSHDSWVVRISARGALDRLETANDQLVGGYIQAFSASKQARLEAVKELSVLGRGNAQAYDALKSLLKELDPDIRSAGVRALAILGNHQINEVLVDMLEQEKNVEVLAALVFAMGELKISQAKQILNDLLSGNMDPRLFSEVVRVLHELGDTALVDFLLEKFRQRNQLSPVAARELGLIKAQAAKEPLLEALADNDFKIRQAARVALRSFEGFSDRELGLIQAYEAKEHLLENLADSRFEIRHAAREALSNFPGFSDPRITAYDTVIRKVSSENFNEAYSIVLSGDDVEEYTDVTVIPGEYVEPQIYSGDSGKSLYVEISEGYYREEQTYYNLRIRRISRGTGKIDGTDGSASSGIDQISAPNAVASAAVTTPVGGIDFNSAALDLQIKRDGNGVPLPLPQQTIQNMKIDGFYPVIINIAPVNIPLLLGQKSQKQPQQLSALR